MAETPSCKASPTGDATNVTCSANFRSERQYRPHFECGPINGSQEIVGSNDVGDAQTITGTFSFARNASNMTIMCSVKFSKSDADLDGTAVNTPQLPWQWIHAVPGTVFFYKLYDSIITAIHSNTPMHRSL